MKVTKPKNFLNVLAVQFTEAWQQIQPVITKWNLV